MRRSILVIEPRIQYACGYLDNTLTLSLVLPLPLILVLIPHIIPRRFTSLPKAFRAGPIGLSIAFLEVVRSGKVLLSQQSLFSLRSTHGTVAGKGKILCEVDTILTIYLFTALIAHLPTIIFSSLKSIPTPSHPYTTPPRARFLLPLIYTYAVLPLLPVFADAGMRGFKEEEGFGMWWGLNCRERGGWWRVGRPISLLPPLLVTIPLTLALAATLYSNAGHPSAEIRPTRRSILSVLLFLSCAFSGIGYIVWEQVQGWTEGWWGRILECIPGYIVLFTYASYSSIWSTWASWIRFRRPTPHTECSSDKLDTSSLPTIRSADMGRRPTSSFYAPHPGAYPLAPTKVLRSVSKRDRWRKVEQEKKGLDDLSGRAALGGLHVRHLGAPSVHGLDEPHKEQKRSLVTVREYSGHRQPVSAMRAPMIAGESLAPPIPARNPRRIAQALSRLRIPSSQPTPAITSGPASPPFTWSITETVPRQTVFSPSSYARWGENTKSDDASSLSRYSTVSPSERQLPRTRVISIRSYTASVHDGGTFGSVDEAEGLKTGDDWVYPEEVFLDFTEVMRGDEKSGEGRSGGSRYNDRRL